MPEGTTCPSPCGRSCWLNEDNAARASVSPGEHEMESSCFYLGPSPVLQPRYPGSTTFLGTDVINLILQESRFCSFSMFLEMEFHLEILIARGIWKRISWPNATQGNIRKSQNRDFRKTYEVSLVK